MSVGDEGLDRTPDWDKVHEVALALLGLCEQNRRDLVRVRPWIPFLEAFEEEGWIEDSNTAAGWIELTESGHDRSKEMLAKHFGIVLGEAPPRE